MNIILIVSDTFRYDNLSRRAAMPVRTTQLEQFSMRAVGLSHLVTSSFPTIPHRTDLTTGRFGWPWYGWQNRAQSGKNHLPGILRQAGYVSQLICDNPHLFRANFDQGFDAACVLRGQEADLPMLWMNHPIDQVMPPEKTRSGRQFQGHNLVDLHRWENRLWRREADRFPPRTAGLAVEWLEENYKWHPFFLWVDFFDPHEPWDPPEYMVRRYDPDYAGTPMLHPNYGKATDLAPEELRNLRAHYAAEAELVDRWVGRIIQKVDDLGLWDNTALVFTADHGTSLGEHNRTGKSNINDRDDRCWPIYPEVAHIPFLIAAPGLKGGRTVDALIQPPDILPTLLDLAGVKARPPDPVHGRSFAPLLRGDGQQPIRDVAISASHWRRKSGEKPNKAVTPVVYTEKWAYVPIGPYGERELYDLADDPLAEKNVAAGHDAQMRDLHGRLLDWLKKIDAPKEAAAAIGE
jgi:arylsulfatase A-like enzyme